mmetsp:Transcript_104246/g.185234  ORF Transcript_104246/g.185234 Transcript_104246/m.185234 type:complete len:769 (+) Transcript_104246:113-2419(+)
MRSARAASVLPVGQGEPGVESTPTVVHAEEQLDQEEGQPSDVESDASSTNERDVKGPVIVKNPYDDLDVGAHPSEVPRRCTDIGWLLVFCACCITVGFIAAYAFENGQPELLRVLANWRGQKCGHTSQTNRDLVFFCLDDRPGQNRQLQMWYPICVSECPTSNSNTTECPRNVNLYNVDIDEATTTTAEQSDYVPLVYLEPGGDPAAQDQDDGLDAGESTTPPSLTDMSVQTGMAPALPAASLRRLQMTNDIRSNIVLSDWRGNFTMVEAYAYPAFNFVDLVCVPWEADLQKQVNTWIKDTPLVSSWSTLMNAYQPLLVAMFSSVILAYVYITLLRFHANFLVWAGLTILTVVPLGWGAYSLWCWKHGHQSRFEDKTVDLVSGVATLVVGFTFMMIACRLGDKVDNAIGCIEWSCKAVLETPSLKLEPVLVLAIRLNVYVLAMAIISGVLTAAMHDDEVSPTQTSQALLPPLDTIQYVMLALVAFWALWVNWIITAISQFAVIYTTELWCFNGGLQQMMNLEYAGSHVMPCCPIMQGWYISTRYHLGTMIYGGLAIGAAQPARLVIAAMTSASRMENNTVGACLSCCCSCFVQIFEQFLEPISRAAFMDVALNARPFMEAALHATEVCKEKNDTAHILNGATWLFQMAGMGGITVMGNVQTWFIVRHAPGFMDPLSPNFVQKPEFLAFCGAFISLIMAFPFMMLFDIVSDTILFCWTVDEQRRYEQPASMFNRACGFLPMTMEDITSCHCAARPNKDVLAHQVDPFEA